jgi:hypothetical protein
VWGTEVWTQGFTLAKQALYAWATALVHFAVVILEMEFSQTVCPGWPQTTLLLISASQVARIIGRSHQYLVFLNFLRLVLWSWIGSILIKDPVGSGEESLMLMLGRMSVNARAGRVLVLFRCPISLLIFFHPFLKSIVEIRNVRLYSSHCESSFPLVLSYITFVS